MNRVKDKVVLITGATQGIGEAAAALFLEEGAKVVLCARSEKTGAALAHELGENCRFCKLDVSSYENWQKCIDYTLNEFGKLDVLINNAGISVVETIADTTPESYDAIIDVNQKGVFYGMKLAIEAMKNNPAAADRNTKCAIVNTASIDGVVGDPLYFSYCASKAAVEAMTRCAAIYCGQNRLNIRVNAVAPGYIMTPMARQDAEEKGMTVEEYEREMAVSHPIGHLGRPEDIAYAYLYLASDEASFVTGTTLAVDGGYTII
ncbi:MAG: glucose 1-dehydrogenase [Firmicutes bacterium]|nr:glucose 1-dehydrogenase [Bacillota bacterium]